MSDSTPSALARSLEQKADESAIRDCSILIVEDDQEVREALELLVRAAGHHPTAAANGVKAIQLVEHDLVRPDLVIVDYNLPNGLTGLQVMSQLREVLDHGLPALVLTGDISTETIREIAARGYVQRSKPVRADDLTGLIRRLLGGRNPESLNRWSSLAQDDAAHVPVVFLVDDDYAVLEAMRDLLSESGRKVETYASAESFLEAYCRGDEGCLLVDAVMPGMDGFALLRRLKDEGHSLPAIMITGHGDIPTAVRAIRAGAIDFISKPVSPNELLTSIDRALALAAGSDNRPAVRAATASMSRLTARQRQILDLVLAGRPSKIIAADLGISQRTVETHRSDIMQRTGAKSLSELVRLALTAS
jgi:two-component system CheB/CheR fusion protein